MARKPAEAKNAAGAAAPRKRRRKASEGPWRLPPLPWILGAGRGSLVPAEPLRIFSASLPEAFLLASHLREAEVVALDEAQGRVRAARTSASRRRLRNLRIEQAPLDQPALGELIGGNFDVVLAHEVLHRCADPDAAWTNLSAACAPEGSVFVTVRGPSHPVQRFDEALAQFGLDRGDDAGELPDALKIHQLLAGLGGFAADLPNGEAASSAAPAREWIARAAGAGLHLRATTLTARYLPRALAGGGTRLLTSFALPSLAVFLDNYLHPETLEMVFSRRAPAEPPWRYPEALAGWIPLGRFLPLAKLPPLEAPWDALAAVDVEILGVIEPQNFTLSRYMLELLRRSDGRTSLRDLMAAIPHETSPEDLVGGLHFLHHAFILELLPPAA